MRIVAFTLTMLAGLSFAAAQDVVRDREQSAEETNEAEAAEREPAVEVTEREPEERVEQEVVDREEPEEVDEQSAGEVRSGLSLVPPRGPPRPGPLMGVRDTLRRRELERELEENSLGLPFGMLLGGAAGAVGFTSLALALCNAEEDPLTGESSCTRPAATGAFVVLGIASYLITLGGVGTLLVRVIKRRVAYRRFRSRGGISLTGSGLELSF